MTPTMERDSLVARLRDAEEALWHRDLYVLAEACREAAAALSRPVQVVTDEMVSAAYEELRRRLTLHPSRDQVKAAIETARSCLTTAAQLQADASAPASPAIGIQAVKALEWVDPDGAQGLRHAKDGFGGLYWVYGASPWAGPWKLDLRTAYDSDFEFPVQEFCTREEAFAAAQADYEQRIRSALHPAPEAASAGAAGEVERFEITYDPDIGMIHRPHKHGYYVRWSDYAALSDTAPSPKGVSDRAKFIADALGVTPYSDMRVYVIRAVELALTGYSPATAEERAASKEGA